MHAVAIIDYGTGNISSIGRALSHLGVGWVVTRDPEVLVTASHVILPGVGHGGRAMAILKESHLVDSLNEAVHVRRVPVLGICLGMQLMTSRTSEGAQSCLGWFGQETTELDPGDTRLKVPNIGWHTLSSCVDDEILAGINLAQEPFYFCHRFGVAASETDDVSATLDYGMRYAAVLRRDNVIGVQFHPEKSQEPGLRLFRNFLALERAGV